MPSPVAELLAVLGGALNRLGLRWYLFGAQAAIIHGSARLTGDVDVTVDLAGHSAHELVGVLRELGFELRVQDVDDFAARTSVLPFGGVSARQCRRAAAGAHPGGSALGGAGRGGAAALEQDRFVRHRLRLWHDDRIRSEPLQKARDKLWRQASET
jgi:hypothetical protein